LAGELRGQVPVASLCDGFGLPRASWYRCEEARVAKGLGDSDVEAPIPAKRAAPPNALSAGERDQIRETLNSAEYADRPIPQVYTHLLDKGQYLGSPSSMYRVMREHGEVRERRAQAPAGPAQSAPRLHVTKPNELWSWDITKLRGLGLFYCLYVLLDVYSRYVVGWLLAEHQSGKLAAEMIAAAMRRQNLLTGADQDVPAHALTLLADNGGPMVAKPLIQLMSDLDVRRVHTRPHTPNDNAYSESQFRTMKYRPEYPDRFESMLDARGWCQTFFNWYNHQHYHSGIGMLPPATVHEGRVEQHLEMRRQALALAFNAHPERFRYRMPILEGPKEVWINRPDDIPGLIHPAKLTKL
jgi:putative transposase